MHGRSTSKVPHNSCSARRRSSGSRVVLGRPQARSIKADTEACVLVDLRNIYHPEDMKKRGFVYTSVGVSPPTNRSTFHLLRDFVAGPGRDPVLPLL